MNTAIQTKTHTAKSAKSKSLHNERKDKSIKNPDYVILQKDNYHKFQQKEQVKAPKTTAKQEQQEKALKKELATIQSKISTYSKRVNEYEAREKPNFAKIDKLKEQIKELELQKSKIPTLSDKRGKPQKVKYVEFELSLTNSNHLKHDKSVQQAFIKSFNELRKDEIFKDLKSVSDVMHLDQHSLHIHSLNKLVNGKSWNSIVESQKLSTDKDGRDVYSRLQNRFNDIVRKNFKELNLDIEPQQKGIQYLSLKRYKEKTNFKSQDQQQAKEPLKKDLSRIVERQEFKKQQPQQQQAQQAQQPQPKKENLLEKFDEIDKKNDDNFFNNLIEKNIQLQKNANYLDIKDILDNGLKKEEKKEEKEVKKDENQAQNDKKNTIQQNLSKLKEAQERVKNEKENEKKQEKSNSKKLSRSR